MKKFYPLLLLVFALVFCGPPDRVGDMLVDAGNAMRDGGAIAAPVTLRWESYEVPCTLNDAPERMIATVGGRAPAIASFVTCVEEVCSSTPVRVGVQSGELELVFQEGLFCPFETTQRLVVGFLP